MPSFDIVSEINLEEARNACENASRELDTRYDFRGVEASFEWQSPNIKVKAEADFQLEQMLTMLRLHLAKRNIDAKALSLANVERSGKTFTQLVSFKQGIEQAMAKKLVKLIKDSKLKVQASIQGDKLRVTGKKRDDLQAVMQLVRTAELEQSFQFNNFRD